MSADPLDPGRIASQEVDQRRTHKLSMSTKVLYDYSPVEEQMERDDVGLDESCPGELMVEESVMIVPETPENDQPWGQWGTIDLGTVP